MADCWAVRQEVQQRHSAVRQLMLALTFPKTGQARDSSAEKYRQGATNETSVSKLCQEPGEKTSSVWYHLKKYGIVQAWTLFSQRARHIDLEPMDGSLAHRNSSFNNLRHRRQPDSIEPQDVCRFGQGLRCKKRSGRQMPRRVLQGQSNAGRHDDTTSRGSHLYILVPRRATIGDGTQVKTPAAVNPRAVTQADDRDRKPA